MKVSRIKCSTQTRRVATGRHSLDNSGLTFDGGLIHGDAAGSR